MASKAKEPTADGPIDAVLLAERDAEQAVERAQREGRASVERAREKARRIRERTDRRIAALSAAALESTERGIQVLRAEEAERREQLSQRGHDPLTIEAAVQRVADWLLGAAR